MIFNFNGLGEIIFYDQCFNKRWTFWKNHQEEIKELISKILSKEYEMTEGIETNTLSQEESLKEKQKLIPKLNFRNKPDSECLEMIYNCLDKIDDLSNCQSLESRIIREYHRLYLLTIFIAFHTNLNKYLKMDVNILDYFNEETLIELSESFTVSSLIKEPFDYLGYIYENLYSSKLKNISLRSINDSSNYGLIFTSLNPNLPFLIDLNVETGRRMLSLSNDYFIILGQSCSILETLITKINLHLYSPWVLYLSDLFKNLNGDDINYFIFEILKNDHAKFSYLYPDNESLIKNNNKTSFLDYSLNNGYSYDLFLTKKYNSFPIILKTKKPQNNLKDKIPEIQYLPKLQAIY